MDDHGAANHWVVPSGERDIIHREGEHGLSIAVSLEVAEITGMPFSGMRERMRMAFRVVMAPCAGAVVRAHIAKLMHVDRVLRIRFETAHPCGDPDLVPTLALKDDGAVGFVPSCRLEDGYEGTDGIAHSQAR